jgi:putative alginate regulatory protein algP
MLGISGGEFLVLLVVGALVLGPKNIAEALRAMRKGIEALRQWSAGMRAGADGELGVAEKEVAALANLDLRQLDPRRIVREAVRDEMEAWMAMAGAGGAGPSSSEKGADPAGDGANRAARTAERAAYSAAAFARAGSERAGSRRTSSKRAGPKGADAAATKGAHATQEPDACPLHEPAACAPHKPAAQAAQGLDGQGPHKPAAQAAQGRAAQAEPEPNEKSPGELSAARDSIEGDKL